MFQQPNQSKHRLYSSIVRPYSTIKDDLGYTPATLVPSKPNLWQTQETLIANPRTTPIHHPHQIRTIYQAVNKNLYTGQTETKTQMQLK